jgi:hypothetical protein
MLFTHKLFSGRAALLRRPNFSAKAEQQLGPTVFDPGNKKAPTQDEKGRQKRLCTLLIFPKLMVLELELAPVIETKVQSVAVVSSGQSLDHSS